MVNICAKGFLKDKMGFYMTKRHIAGFWAMFMTEKNDNYSRAPFTRCRPALALARIPRRYSENGKDKQVL